MCKFAPEFFSINVSVKFVWGFFFSCQVHTSHICHETESVWWKLLPTAVELFDMVSAQRPANSW